MAHELSEKRLERLKDPYIAAEVRTIDVMARIYCKGRHGAHENGLCEECADFVAYATKRLACCPFGADKPVCKKCKIHCFQASYKDKAKDIMAYAGPRLTYTHPVMALRHIAALFREAPEKPKAAKPKAQKAE